MLAGRRGHPISCSFNALLRNTYKGVSVCNIAISLVVAVHIKPHHKYELYLDLKD
jgi:hypothetical protein